MPYLINISILVLLFLAELFYFRLADRFSIIDKPNERSSHRGIIIRGGGIIFYLGGLLFFILSGWSYPFFIVGLTFISLISLVDDMQSVPNRVRIVFHIMGMLLLLLETGILTFFPWWAVLLSLILTTGIVNAFNFMDGINGITGGYSLVAILTLLYLNMEYEFIHQQLLVITLLSLLVFNFFNFRKKARCFAGDVGSVSIAFILIFVLARLMIHEGNFIYILLIGVYGVDSILTIIHRLLKKENIFKAHRSHLYQYMVNEEGIPHLWVAGLYMMVQLLVNVFVLYLVDHFSAFQQVIGACGVIGVLCLVYVFFKVWFVRRGVVRD